MIVAHSRGAVITADLLYRWATKPSPDEIGLRSWTNLYESGDYVGRSLWRAGDAAWTLAPWAETAARRFEQCLGAGAHAHYWRAPGTAVALAIDREILAIAPPGRHVTPASR